MDEPTWRDSRAAILIACAACLGCGGGTPVRPRLPNEGKDPTALAKCSVSKSQASPLVTEWPASEKANLESRLREGAVVAAYSGCEMRLLPQCKPGGKYLWSRTTLAEDTVEIRNEDDLYAKLPLGAASLEAELKSSGRLAVRTTVVGQLKLDGVATADVPQTGDCTGATHIISSLSVGAFRLMAGGAAKASGGVNTPVASTGGATSAEEILVRKAGNPAKCSDATEDRPDGECSSPIQVFLWPLPKLADASAGDDGAAPAPPGAVRFNFLLPDATEKWRLMEKDKVVCDFPCTRWIGPGRELTLRRDGARASDTLNIEFPKDLGGYSAGRTVDALPQEATDTRVGLGLAATIVGGIGTMIGGVFVLAGCTVGESDASYDQNHGLCTPGKFMLPVGVALLALGIPLLATSRLGNSVAMSLAPDPHSSRSPALRFGPGFATLRTGRESNLLITPTYVGGVF